MTGLTIEQQRAIAIANARARGATATGPSGPSGFQTTMAGVNTGLVSDLAGAPVDLVNAGLGLLGWDIEEPFGGSASIQRGLSDLGMTVPPGDPLESDPLYQVGRFGGNAVGTAMTAGVAGAPAAAAAAAGRPAATVGGRIMGDITTGMVQAPVRTLTGEIAAGVAAGSAGVAIAERFPNEPGARVLAEVLGGFTPAGIAAGIGGVTRIAANGPVVGTIRNMFSSRIGQARAGARMQSMTGDLESVLMNLDAEYLPGTTVAQRSGDPGLLSLERAVIEASQQDIAASSQQISDMTRTIYQSLQFEGNPQQTAETLNEAQNYLRSLLEARVQIAATAAAERISRIGPEASREAVNIAAHEELTAALTAARSQESELWSAVPLDVTVPAGESRAVMEGLLASTPRAQRGDIPSIARSILSDAGEDVPEGFEEAYRAFGLTETSFGENMPITELQGLRSRMLEDARIARANRQRNTARIMDQIADAIMRDMDAVEEVSAPIRLAMDFSRTLNDRFTRGPVGRLLGYAREGDFRIDPRLTLERTAGRGDVTGDVEQSALLAAMQTGNEPAMRDAIDGFLRHRFLRAATTDEGQLKDTAARTFLARFDTQLNEFPELRAEIREAIDANNASMVLQNRVQQQTSEMSDPRVSSTAVYLNAPPNREMDRVAASANPGQVMLDLVQTVGRDATGEALQGLKVSFGDYLLRRSSTREATEAGDFIISGLALRRMLNEGPTGAMSAALMSPAERANLAVIAETAARIEAAAAARPATGGIINDAPGQLRSALAGILGASLGRRIGTGTIQTPGIVSNAFRRLQSMGMNDPARRILIDAMQDEELFRALVTLPNTEARREFINRSINTWATRAARYAGLGLQAEFGDLEGAQESQ